MRTMQSLPGPVVRQLVSAWAPLARYGGASKGGSLALRRAMRLLSEPPAMLRHSDRPLTTADLAQRLGRSEEDLARWARWGLLGEPEAGADGHGPLWGAAAAERARLVDYLRRHGVGEDELRAAHAQHRIPLLAIDQTVAEPGIYSVDDVARMAGVDADFINAMGRALGLAPGEREERVYTRRDLESLRILAALRSVYSDAELIEAASVLGLAMAQVAGSQVELFRRRVGVELAGDGGGSLDSVLRVASMVDLMLPTVAQLMENVHRRHIEVSVRGESVAAAEAATGGLPGQVELCVGFADLVGFTAASEQLLPLELGEMAGALVRHAEETLPRHGARIVKTIGDAIMFTAVDTPSAALAAVELVESAAGDEVLPPMRVGMASGPVLRRYGDYFGRTVNVASRLCAVASPGAVLLHSPVPLDEGAWEAAGVAAGRPMRLRVKGIEGGLEALPVRRA